MKRAVAEPGSSKKNVTKSNDLVKAAYKLSLNEQRLLLAAISQIDPRKPMPRPISITAPDFSDQYGIPLKHAYEALKEATSSLYERDVKTYDGRYKSRFRWVDRVDYLDGGGDETLLYRPRAAVPGSPKQKLHDIRTKANRRPILYPLNQAV